MTVSSLRPVVLALFGASLLLGSLSVSAATKKKPVSEPAPVEAPLVDLTPEQVSNAERVYVGDQSCEFSQQVKVTPVQEKLGYFRLHFKGKQYTMAPEPTTTGAVRLEDKKNGLVWIQIANKSMLMNARAGQRLVDECVHPNQKLPPALEPLMSALPLSEPLAHAR